MLLFLVSVIIILTLISLFLLIYLCKKNNMNTEITNHIKDKIKILMKEKNYNLNSLALNCGLNASALRMLYSGATKSPSFDTIYKLAEFFDCSLDELIGRKQYYSLEDKQDFSWDPDKYTETVSLTCEYIKSKGYNPNYSKVSNIIKEAYIFFIRSNNGVVDKRIIEWSVDKNLDESLI